MREKTFKHVVTLSLILLLSNVAINLVIPLVQATYVEYPDLAWPHLWDNLASSLEVIGTVILYEHPNFAGQNRQFTDTSVNLADYNFDNTASSLKVSGTTYLYDESNWSGWRRIAFSSSPIPSDEWGVAWNENPCLAFGLGGWDSRTWQWYFGDLYIEAPEVNNYVNWMGDGLVESKATDSFTGYWRATNFDQGYENNAVHDRCPELPFGGYSLKVNGIVTLYDQPNYQGNSISFMDESIPDLGVYGWGGRAQSLVVDGTVNLWSNIWFWHYRVFFTKVSAQPPPLKVSDCSAIRLEGVVTDWWWNYSPDSPSGIKFDVILTQNHSNPNAVRLMMEFYIVGQGTMFLLWGGDRENTF